MSCLCSGGVQFLRRENIPLLAWTIWILSGVVFYSLYDEFPLYVAVYKSVSVGWAIGWSLPVQTLREDDMISMLFSSSHNCIGVIFVGLSAIYISQEIANSEEDWAVQIMNRQSLKDLEVTGLSGRVKRWYLLHKVLVRLIAVMLGLICLCISGGYAGVHDYSFQQAADMTLSTISCSGYASLPEEGEQPVLYILLALFANFAVPIFTIALASLISLVTDTPDEKYFYSKIAAPLKTEEVKYMRAFGIDDDDGLLDCKEFVVLTIIRIGTVPPGLVLDVVHHFKNVAIQAKEEGEGSKRRTIPYASIEGYTQTAPPQLSFRRESHPHPTAEPSGSSSIAPFPSRDSLPPHQPARSAPEALCRRRQRRDVARQSLLQLGREGGEQRQREREDRATLEASREGVRRRLQEVSELVPFPPPQHDKNSKRVTPTTVSSCRRMKDDLKNKQDIVAVFDFNYDDDEVDVDIESGSHNLLHSAMLMQAQEEAEESHGDEEEEVVVVEEEEEEEEEEEDDEAYVEIRPPSLMGTPESNSRKPNSDKHDVRNRTLSMEMDRDSFVGGDKGVRYKNSSVLKRRTERRDTFIPSGTYEILSIQNRRKSALKLQRKKKLAKAFSAPSLLLKSARTSTVDALKRNLVRRSTMRATTLTHLRKFNAAQLHALRNNQTLKQQVEESEDLCFMLGSLFKFTLKDPYVQAFLVWLLWLVLATLFYCLKMDLSFYRGFYMSVNVGYAIYWTHVESDAVEKIFSICHIIVGQIMISFALATFAKAVTNWNKEWYIAESAKDLATSSKLSLSKGGSKTIQWSTPEGRPGDEDSDSDTPPSFAPVRTVQGCMENMSRKVYLFCTQQKVHLFLLIWLVWGVAWSAVSVGWSVVHGVYFAVTALSRGGFWPIQENSSDLQYFAVALFTCTGAPIMCLSGGIFAHWVSTLGKAALLHRKLRAAITLNELRMMISLKIDDGEGFMDQMEYIILVLVRIKAIRPELIAAVLARFQQLDANGLGAVPYDIFQCSPKATSAAAAGAVSTAAAVSTVSAVDENKDESNGNVSNDLQNHAGSDNNYADDKETTSGLIQIIH